MGAVAGAVVGAVAGGYVGKAVEEAVDPTTEDAYWQSNYNKRPYVAKETNYETYRPAYQYGWESYGRYAGRRFEEVEPELQRDWPKTKSQLSWENAKQAVRDAWNRLEAAFSGSTDPKVKPR